MGGSGKPEQKSDQIDWTKAEFHFAVRTREGKQVKVAIIPWPRPVSGSGAPAPVEILKNPKWADAQAGKGARRRERERAGHRVQERPQDERGNLFDLRIEQRIRPPPVRRREGGAAE